MRFRLASALGIVSSIAALLPACTTAASDPIDAAEAALEEGAPVENFKYDVRSIRLDFDVATLTAKAAIEIAGQSTASVSFEIGDLAIQRVLGGNGRPLAFVIDGKKMHVKTGSTRRLDVEYTVKPHNEFNGWDPTAGVSFLWPTFCGNLFPCKSSPNDGVEFSLRVTGTPAGKTAIYPTRIPNDAPTYMPAVAIGDFTEVDLGATTAGTRVKAWHLPGQEDVTAQGTAHLRQAFDYYEQTFGPYAFGNVVGSVSADWGPGDYGGMEHHPYWHVARGSMYDEVVHAHEAAHGWFGNGVRVACWEDFVLSEGTATYLAARALEKQGVSVWPRYECSLKKNCDADPSSSPNTIALPDSTCTRSTS